MGEGAAVGEGDELREGVGAFRAAEERRVSALRADEGGFLRRGEVGDRAAAEGCCEGHLVSCSGGVSDVCVWDWVLVVPGE